MPLDFDPSLSAAQNIEKFHKHMETIDSELAAVLKQNMALALPLPDGQTQRRAARQKFNEAVIQHLDKPKVVVTK